ncbi:MAG: epoxide hydrolase [Nevskia sp.]|nr:epoxide hydrolase [Nevskia sp.]
MTIEPFKVAVAEEVLTDLKQRLERTRWAEDFGNDGWEYGTNGAYLRELVAHWRDRYDWREHERAMNAFPQFRTVIDEVPIHFIHVRGKGPRPMPLIMSHGWPWTFWDYRKLIGPLTDPAAYGGDPADAFDVVVPSLPGYGFSTPLTRTGLNFWSTADLWVKLMERLGYPRFAAHGGDWGALITGQLGHKYAERLIGAHFTLMVPLDLFTGGAVDPADFAPEEKHWIGENARFFADDAGYFAIQTTRPQTIAFALNDSPVGLCSWILEKRRAWSDCGGQVETRFPKDDLLTTVMLYWVTRSYGTSARYYYEAAHRHWQPSVEGLPVVRAPTGIMVFEREVLKQPRRWAERYYNLKRWNRFERGGHFAQVEEPERVLADLRTFFGALRQ